MSAPARPFAPRASSPDPPRHRLAGSTSGISSPRDDLDRRRPLGRPVLTVPGRAHGRTEALMRQVLQSGAIAPSLLRLDVANALEIAIRGRRIDAALRDAALRDLPAFPIAVDVDTDRNACGSTLNLATQHGLTVYDAAYLELAQRPRLPLGTLDGELRAACREAKVQALPAGGRCGWMLRLTSRSASRLTFSAPTRYSSVARAGMLARASRARTTGRKRRRRGDIGVAPERNAAAITAGPAAPIDLFARAPAARAGSTGTAPRCRAAPRGYGFSPAARRAFTSAITAGRSRRSSMT